jgi:hypothetical protein
MSIRAKLKELENYSMSFYDVKHQLKEWVYGQSDTAFERGDAARDEVRTIAELENRKRYIRDKLLESIGELPPLDSPLHPVVTGEVDCSEYRIEKIIFQSRPHVYVTCNLYLPEGLSSPRGAVLFLCGHFDEAKHAERYQIVCQFLARAGLIVLARCDPCT